VGRDGDSKETTMKTYSFATDACLCDVEAENLDAAVAEFAAGEDILGVATLVELERHMERVGGRVRVTENGIAVE
jgi:hypothetical protein